MIDWFPWHLSLCLRGICFPFWPGHLWRNLLLFSQLPTNSILTLCQKVYRHAQCWWVPKKTRSPWNNIYTDLGRVLMKKKKRWSVLEILNKLQVIMDSYCMIHLLWKMLRDIPCGYFLPPDFYSTIFYSIVLILKICLGLQGTVTSERKYLINIFCYMCQLSLLPPYIP